MLKQSAVLRLNISAKKNTSSPGSNNYSGNSRLTEIEILKITLNQLTMKNFFLILTLALFSFCCFSHSSYISKTTKKIVYTRDGGKFQCCGSFEN
ncbi:MAG TPA: hypothetical protein DCF44_03960, partial [Chitinophagaceae bacterium]|nr:hypothetical protein [Chitinophagaceae bacterium]